MAPSARHSSTCGLDFGTSNSTLALAGAGGSRLIALEDAGPTLPSVIFFGFEDDRVYFGREALRQHVSGAEGRLMRLRAMADKKGRPKPPFLAVKSASFTWKPRQ